MTDQPGPQGDQPDISELIAGRDARDARMSEPMAIGEAERVVAGARFAEVDARPGGQLSAVTGQRRDS
jgi:hypothetical protein